MSYNYKQPTIADLVHKLNAIYDPTQNQQQQILQKLLDDGLNSQNNLHWLYSIVKCKSPEDQKELINSIDIQFLIADWIQQDNIQAVGLSNSLTARSLEQIIELLDMEMQQKIDQFATESSYYVLMKEMLTWIFNLIDKSHSFALRSQFLNCISKIYQVRPDLINIDIYAELLCKMESKMDEFFTLFMEYMQTEVNQKESVIRCLLDGFAFRMEIYVDKNHLTLLEKNVITNCYLSITKALKQGNQNNWPLMLLKEYEPLIQYLLVFTTKNLHPLKLADIINALIEIYVYSNINNPDKFNFLLSLYKHIIIKSSSLFTFIITNFLANQSEFLYWFVETELRLEKAKQIVEVYLSNQYSVEFLMVVVIYYLHQHPSKISDMAALMRVINLMEESKYFLQAGTVKRYLQIFHAMIHEEDIFEDFMNSVEDRAHSLDQ